MSQSNKPISFDREFEAVIISPDATEIDLTDMIDQRLTQLQAMIHLNWDKVSESEPDSYKRHRNAYMWLFNRTVSEVESLSRALWDKHADY